MPHICDDLRNLRIRLFFFVLRGSFASRYRLSVAFGSKVVDRILIRRARRAMLNAKN